jgi:hypothetical protein
LRALPAAKRRFASCVFVLLATNRSRAMAAGSKKTATRNKRETEKKDGVEQKTGRVSFEMLQTQH